MSDHAGSFVAEVQPWPHRNVFLSNDLNYGAREGLDRRGDRVTARVDTAKKSRDALKKRQVTIKAP